MVERRWRRSDVRSVTVLALAVLGLSLAGCGGGGKAAATSTGTSSASGAGGQLLAKIKYARCMRGHGVNVLDPNQHGDIRIDAPNTPPAVVQQAQDACAAQRRAAFGTAVSSSEHAKLLADMTKFTHCMRQHGIPMADPFSGANGGVGYSVPKGISPSSHAYTDAESACKHYIQTG